MRQLLLKDRQFAAALLDKLERKRLYFRDEDTGADTTHLEIARLRHCIEVLDYALSQDWCR